MEKCKDGKLNPLLLLQALQNVLNDDTILVADGGDFVGSAAYMLRPRGPLQWFDKFNGWNHCLSSYELMGIKYFFK